MLISDESFAKLFSLKATVLLASRSLINGFKKREVNPLPTEECIQVFRAQRYRDRSIVPSYSEEKTNVLKGIVEDLAGRNSLIVNRLGSMARDHGWNITTLADKLKTTKLQVEINKLYFLEDIGNTAKSKHP